MNLSKWPKMIGASLVVLGTSALLGGCYENRNKSIELMNQGVEAGRQKLYDTATRQLKLATETDPTNYAAWANLGAVYKDQKKWDECASAFKEAAKLQDGRADFHYEIGTAYEEAALEIKRMDPQKMAKMDAAEVDRLMKTVPGKLDQAKVEFEKALQIQRSYKTHFRLGTVLEAQDTQASLKSADAEYRKAIELNPRFPEPFTRLGNLYLDHDYDQEAVKVFEEAAKVNPTSGEVQMGLGEALQKTKKYEEAVKAFKAALERNGELFMAVYDIGMTYKMMDDKKNAREWLQRFVSSAGTKGTPDLMKAASDAMYQLDAP